MEIPSFSIAVEQFREFLQRNGAPSSIVWTFRDDLCPRSANRFLVRPDSRGENERLCEKVFGEAKHKGLVEISAVAASERMTAATIWYPRTERDEVQGWNQGMKLSVIQPLPRAEVIDSAFFWQLVRFSPAFRRYQADAAFVGTREWAVA
jgi:hypothetical protein